ncbi:large ATP-binding protein [Streptomyces sp. 900116325]|uniref:large ATP-binding protein n=1 Tax=Streptomyces sp. NPDC005525 TaxID=3364720 RepID=UPI00367E60FB
MNPHDAAERPGAHLVAEEFGIEDPWALSDNHPLRDPLDLVGRLVAKAARDVDELHGQLTRVAQSALDLLAPVARGEHASMRGWHGVLQTTGPQIELLVARRGAAYEQLTRAISAYHRLLPDPDAAQHSNAKVHDLNQQRDSGRDDDWAIAGDRRLTALEAVEAGGLRIRLTGIGDDPYLSDGTGGRPQPLAATVQRLVADGLLHQDTSENVYQPGQLLSLTPQGEAALRDACTATPRVSAALRRSSAPTGPGPLADSATAPVTTALGKPSRSR